MNEYLVLVFALVSGIVLGLFFFLGLWWTVRRMNDTKYVAVWFLGSFLVRTVVVVIGFYFILGDSWQRLLAGLLGFMIARMVVIKSTGLAEKDKLLTETVDHAP